MNRNTTYIFNCSHSGCVKAIHRILGVGASEATMEKTVFYTSAGGDLIECFKNAFGAAIRNTVSGRVMLQYSDSEEMVDCLTFEAAVECLKVREAEETAVRA